VEKIKAFFKKIGEALSALWKKVCDFAKKHKKLTAVIIILLIIIILALILIGRKKAQMSKQMSGDVKTATAYRGDLSASISSSGTLEAKNTYNLTALVSGEIVSADFEEGDIVKKDQVLYKIDTSSMDSKLKLASNSLARSQTSYDDAVKDLEEAQENYSDNTYKATRTGFIKDLKIDVGDKINGNTPIADIYNEKTMKIRIPFLSAETAYIGYGNGGTITLSDTLEQIGGTVIAVSNMDEVLDGGRLVRYVTFQVQNPGGLTTEMTATAQIGDFLSAGEGTFEAMTDTTMSAELNQAVEVEKLLVSEGDYVTEGTPIFKMTDESAEKLMRSYTDAVDKAEESMENAEQNFDSTQSTYDEYTITAPCDGQIIKKNYKVGDKISSGGNSAVTLAIVYDMSEYTFEMSVDELDILKVEVGQDVRIEADAFDGETFSGKVTSVSMVSESSNGVSSYPVTVTLDETYELLPGMNVDGYIIIGEAQDVILIPSDSLMRGNQVYVKDDTVESSDGIVPDGFRAVEVETGLTSEDYVEIKSGISEGDVVFVPETSSDDFFMFPGAGGGFPGGGSSGGFPSGGSGGGPSGGPSGGPPSGF